MVEQLSIGGGGLVEPGLVKLVVSDQAVEPLMPHLMHRIFCKILLSLNFSDKNQPWIFDAAIGARCIHQV